MAAIDQLLLEFPPDNVDSLTDDQYDDKVKDFLVQLGSMLGAHGSLLVSSAPQLIQLLDPSVNSISILLLINRLKGTSNSPVPRPELTRLVTQFLESFDGRQIRYVGDLFADLIQELVEGKWVPKPQVVGLLASAILRLDPAGEMLTSNHISLVNIALDSGQYEAALPVLEKPYVFLPMADQAVSNLGAKNASPWAYILPRAYLTGIITRDDIMRYDEACGLIFGRLRRWKDAHAAFGRIVAFPSRDASVTAMMAESYKKWVLTGLLALGHAPKMPSYAHPGSSKQYHVAAKVYDELAAVFADEDVTKLRAEVDKNMKVWEDEDTVSWIGEILAGYQKWQIVGLGNLYSKISISEVRELTNSAETGQQLPTDQDVETLVSSMIESGILHGSLSTEKDTTCLTFNTEGQALSEAEFAAKIQESIKRLAALGEIVKVMDHRLMVSKEYISQTAKDQKRNEKGFSAGMDAGFGFDQSVEDEDLMVGIAHG